MGDYTPPFRITNEILAYVASISEKIGKISAISNLELCIVEEASHLLCASKPDYIKNKVLEFINK